MPLGLTLALGGQRRRSAEMLSDMEATATLGSNRDKAAEPIDRRPCVYVSATEMNPFGEWFGASDAA